MKKILIIFCLFFFIVSTPLRAETEDTQVLLRGFSHLYPAIDHVYTGLFPGIALSKRTEIFPMLAVNISLTDTYFLEACLGASQINDMDGGLAQHSIGLGHYDAIEKLEDIYYYFSLSLRNFNATYISSSALVLEALLEQKLNKVYFGIGIDLISQDYKISSGGKYSADKDRIYHAAMVLHARTPFLNLRASGLPGEINVNFSVNLNMEKK